MERITNTSKVPGLVFPPEPMLEGPRKSSLPTRANARRTKKDQGLLVIMFAVEFFPTVIWVFSIYLLYKCLQVFHLSKPVRMGMFHSDDEMVQSNYLL